jgi:hypothetical protein
LATEPGRHATASRSGSRHDENNRPGNKSLTERNRLTCPPEPRPASWRIARLRADGTDLLGFRKEVLLAALDYAHARQFLPSDWHPQVDDESYAMAYLDFAIGKILDHRSNSASRSVDKLTELAWLAGRDDVVAAMRTAGYPMYGAPRVTAFADGFGWPFTDPLDDPDDQRALTRMARGQQCEPGGCHRGCAD